MELTMKLLITSLLIFTTMGCADTSIANTNNSNFVLTNVNIIDAEQQTVHHDKSIFVNAGKIQSIVDSTAALASSNVQVIDGKGGYVTPGLIDMHVHMYEKAAFALALSHGVTHVRIMNGTPDQLLWRSQIEAGQLVGSSATVSSPIVSAYDASLHHTVHSAKEATDAVKQFKNEGYDLIKAYGNLSEEALIALLEASRTFDIPVAKHGPHASGDMPIVALRGLQSLEHVEDIYQGPLNYEFAPERLPAIAHELSETQVPVTPTLNAFYQLTMLSVEKEVYLESIPTDYTSTIIAFEEKRNQVKRWLESKESMATHNQKTLKFLQLVTQVFNDSGITILVGSDSGVLLSPHGLATHNEMRLMHEAGLSTFEVLAAATVNPANALELENRIGKVSEGFDADFIFSLTSPIDDLRVLEEPDAVIKQGVWYSKQDLTDMRRSAIASRSIWQELWTLWDAL